MLGYEEELYVEWSRLTLLQQFLEVKSLHGFCCYLHVTLQSLTVLLE